MSTAPDPMRETLLLQVALIDRVLPSVAAPPIAPAPTPEPIAAPSPAPTGRRTRRTWSTPARDAVMREHWPAGTPVATVRDLLNALPGDLMSNDDTGNYATSLKLKRPARYQATFGKVMVRTTTPTQPRLPTEILQPVDVRAATVLEWATANGVPAPVTLENVNRKRIAEGLPPYRCNNAVLDTMHAREECAA